MVNKNLQIDNERMESKIKERLESIKNEKLRAMHDMKNQIAQFSIDIAEKLIKTELSDRQRADAFVKSELETIQKQYE